MILQFRIYICAVFLLLAGFSAVCADEKAAQPRVGLVLSGGGARGAAHVGILRVLEELHVPVDFITGTSMGAVIGGLYAMGVSLDEIERMSTSVDWEEIFTDELPRRHETYRSKPEEYRFLFEAELDQEANIKLPLGLISGKRLDLLLRAMTLGAPDNFDAFPIPYRAVAADIATGEAVVISKGELSKAIRASMAIPGVFSPVEIDGRLLVDGGVAKNLPIDVAKAMGADIIIAVNIGTPLSPRKDLTNFISILNQTTNILTNSNVSLQMQIIGRNDILLTPNLDTVTTMSFNKMNDAIRAGEEIARTRREDLTRYSVDEGLYKTIRGEQLSRAVRIDKVEFVKIEKSSLFGSETLLKYIEKDSQSLMDKNVVAKDLFEFYKSGGMEDIDFSILKEDGKNGLLIQLKKPGGVEHRIEMGIEFSSNFTTDNSYRFLTRYTAANLNSLGAEWRNDLWLGDNSRLFSEFYQPLNPSTWRVFVAPYLVATRDSVDIYRNVTDDTAVAEYEADNSAVGMDLGLQLGPYGETRFGYQAGRSKSKLRVGRPGLPETEQDIGALRLRVCYDQLDSLTLPTEGAYASGTFLYGNEDTGSDDKYESLEVTSTAAFTYEKHTLVMKLKGASNFDTNGTIASDFKLGGLLNLSGLNSDQLIGNHLAFGEFIYCYKLKYLPSIIAKGLYAGASFEAGNTWVQRSDMSMDDLIYAGSVFLAADLKIGTVYIGYGQAEEGARSIYFSFGSMMFNQYMH